MRYFTIFLLLFLSCSHSLFNELPKRERAVLEDFDGLAHALMDSGYAVAIGRGVSARGGLSEKEARVMGRAFLLELVDSVLQDINRQAEDRLPGKKDSLFVLQEPPEEHPNDQTDLGLGFAEKFEVIRSECVSDKQDRTVCYAMVRVQHDHILSYFKDTHDIQGDDVSLKISPIMIKELYRDALVSMLDKK